MELDHVAIAVRDIEASIKVYESLGLKLLDREDIKEEGVIAAFLAAGKAKIELIQPTVENAVKGFIEKKGEGLHHITFKVPSVKKSMDSLGKRFEFTSEGPLRRYGRNACFISPKSTGGVLIELVDG